MVFSDFRLSTLSDIRMSSSGSGIFRVRLLETTGAVEVDNVALRGVIICFVSVDNLVYWSKRCSFLTRSTARNSVKLFFIFSRAGPRLSMSIALILLRSCCINSGVVAIGLALLGFGGGRSCISISGLGFTGGGGFMGSVSIGVRCTSDHPSLSRCQFCSSSVLSLSSVSRVMRTLLLFFNLMGFLASVFARGVFSVVDGRGGGRSLK